MTELDPRSQILLASETRFRQYGFNKTTMAEIASDCDMSAANLYRYFENKLAIGAALVTQCFVEKEQQLVAIIDDKDKTATEKLRRFVDFVLHYSFHQYDVSPRIAELIEAISRQKPEICVTHRKYNFHLMQQLLALGRDQGEFVFDDLIETAEAINTAIIPFSFPPLMSMFSLEDFERKADSVLNLIIRSITQS